MKIAGVIPVVLLSLTSCPALVQAQMVQSVSNHLNSTRFPFVQPPKLPDNGAPIGRRRGGTSRDQCPALNLPLTALVPGREILVGETSPQSASKSFLASTLTQHPTFWFYIPHLPETARKAEFLLQNEIGDDVYQALLTLPQKSGVIGISLPLSPQYSLKTGKRYHWYFKVYCGEPQKTPEYFFVDGWVQRIALTRHLDSQLKTAKPRKYAIYAANNIWHDALTELADLRLTNSRNATLSEDWADLLGAVGLQDLAGADVIWRYNQLPNKM